MLDHCRTLTCRPSERDAFDDASTSNCLARSVLRSGPHASTPSRQSQPGHLWRSFDEPLVHGRVPPSRDISASDLHSFFDNKVAGVRAATADVYAPSFTPAPVGCVLRLFSAVTPADVVASVKALPASSVRPIRCQHGCSRNVSASFHRSCVSCSTGRLSTARSRRVSNAPTLRRC